VRVRADADAADHAALSALQAFGQLDTVEHAGERAGGRHRPLAARAPALLDGFGFAGAGAIGVSVMLMPSLPASSIWRGQRAPLGDGRGRRR
jgi:hypothetical protein